MRAVRVSDNQELVQIYELFYRHDPLLTGWYLETLGIKPDRSDLLEKKDQLYVLRFDPTTEPTPPGLEADLKWIWPVAGLLILLVAIVTRPHPEI